MSGDDAPPDTPMSPEPSVTENPPEPTPNPLGMLVDAQDQMRMLLETLEGVRAWYVERGWTDDEARAIALFSLGIVMPENRPPQPGEDGTSPGDTGSPQ